MQINFGLNTPATRFFALMALASIFFGITACANGEDRSSNLPLDLFRNTARVATTPSTAGLLLMMGMTPAIADDESNKLYRPWLNNLQVDHVFELGEWLGSGGLHGLASLSLYSTGKLFHKEHLASVASDLFSAQFIASVMSTGLKVATSRIRPDGAPYSFPSGHSTVAFATAGVIWKRCGKTAGITAQAVATYVALSRLQENKHFVSDIVAGCLLGNYVAFVVSRTDQPEASLRISPTVGARAVGVTLSKKF